MHRILFILGLLIVLLLLSGCAIENNQAVSTEPMLEFLEYQELQHKNPITKGAIGSILFDEHQYVVMLDYAGNPIHFIHNPECPSYHSNN